MDAVLSLHDVAISYGGQTLFSGLNISVGKGQLVGISGESGCGKTSLLRAILGFTPFTAGGATVFGQPLDAQHIDSIRRQTVYLPQELQPLAQKGMDLVRLTLGLSENRPLIHALAKHNHKGSSAKLTLPDEASAEEPDKLLPPGFAALLTSLGLSSDLLELDSVKLSGGQRQRLLLAAALAMPKNLLLLDEPSSALDEESTQRVALALLRTCHEEGRSALVVTHNIHLLGFCDMIISL